MGNKPLIVSLLVTPKKVDLIEARHKRFVELQDNGEEEDSAHEELEGIKNRGNYIS